MDKNGNKKTKKVVDRHIILSYNSIETQYMVFVGLNGIHRTIHRNFI